MMTSTPASRYTARDWDEVRIAFASSILADTPLSSLAQNLEGADWPLRGEDETPSGYIALNYQEMRERLALCGQHPRLADHLIEILKETLAFDDPFGEMVVQGEQAAIRDNPLIKNLAKLGIPEDFPVGEDVAGAGVAGGDGVSRQGGADAGPRCAGLPDGGLRLHDLHRQFRPAG